MKSPPIFIVILAICLSLMVTYFLSRAVKKSEEKTINVEKPDSILFRIDPSELDTNYKLKEIEEAKQAHRIDSILSKFKKKTDEFTGYTYYYDKKYDKYSKGIHSYIVRYNNQIYQRLVITYSGDDWLFVENWSLKSGDEIIELQPSEEIKRTNTYGTVWEICDMEYTMEVQNFLTAIVLNDKNKIRFYGKDYYSDYILTTSQRQKLLKVYDAVKEINDR